MYHDDDDVTKKNTENSCNHIFCDTTIINQSSFIRENIFFFRSPFDLPLHPPPFAPPSPSYHSGLKFKKSAI